MHDKTQFVKQQSILIIEEFYFKGEMAFQKIQK